MSMVAVREQREREETSKSGDVKARRNGFGDFLRKKSSMLLLKPYGIGLNTDWPETKDSLIAFAADTGDDVT